MSLLDGVDAGDRLVEPSLSLISLPPELILTVVDDYLSFSGKLMLSKTCRRMKDLLYSSSRLRLRNTSYRQPSNF